jgi:transposase
MVTNQFGLPLFAKAYSGNKSDKKSIMEMIQKTQQAIDFDDESYWIADSALYTEENIKLLVTDTKWITHIPATVSEAQKLLNSKRSRKKLKKKRLRPKKILKMALRCFMWVTSR